MTSPFSKDEAIDRAVLMQYRLAVEMADRISGRRQAANAFFVPVVSALTITNVLRVSSEWYWIMPVSAAALLVCFLWWRLLASYRAINAAKFKVIHDMEERLPFQMFAKEERYYRSSGRTGYRALSYIEQNVPVFFAVVILVSAIASVLG